MILDVASAQRLLRMEGRLSRIDLVLSGPVEAAAVARLLPEDARLAPASEQSDTVAQLTSAFELNLTALSLLALVVGMFLIYNTVLFSVVQRRAVFGTLRALGTTPGQLLALILVETAVASALGTALGLGLGTLLGQSAVRLVTRTINDLYFVLRVTEAPLTPATRRQGHRSWPGSRAAGRPGPGPRGRPRRAHHGVAPQHLRGEGTAPGAVARGGGRRCWRRPGTVAAPRLPAFPRRQLCRPLRGGPGHRPRGSGASPWR